MSVTNPTGNRWNPQIRIQRNLFTKGLITKERII